MNRKVLCCCVSGLDKLHWLTNQSGPYTLRVDLTKWNGEQGFATYSNFSVDHYEKRIRELDFDYYVLRLDNFTGGNAGEFALNVLDVLNL